MAKGVGNSTRTLYCIKPRIEEWESADSGCRQYEIKISRFRIGHTRLTHRYLMSRNDQKSTCTDATCRNQTLTIKHCQKECPQWRDTRKKYNMQSYIKTLLGRDCEEEKIMMFLKEEEKFEEI